MRFSVDIGGYRDVALNLAHDAKGMFRITSPDIPQLRMFSEDPGSPETGRKIIDEIEWWLAISPEDRARVARHGPRDV
jgi:hypothetical protein